jgi:hypothetical protein
MRRTRQIQIRLTEVTETLDGLAELGQIFKDEYFALAWPEPEPALRLADLFDRLS